MAARVGTGVTGSDDASAGAIASAAKNTTTGNLLVALVKWEHGSGAETVTGLTDTAGNTWTVVANASFSAISDPGVCLAYAKNITGNAANVVTATLSSDCDFRRIIVEEFSGLDTTSPEDQNEQTQTGTGSPFDTAAITTTSAGLVVIGVGAFGTLTSHTGTPGNPDFTVGATVADAAFAYLISGSGQTVTPGMGASGGGGQDVSIAQAFKDAGGGPTNATGSPTGGSSVSAVGSVLVIATPPPPYTLTRVTG